MDFVWMDPSSYATLCVDTYLFCVHAFIDTNTMNICMKINHGYIQVSYESTHDMPYMV